MGAAAVRGFPVVDYGVGQGEVVSCYSGWVYCGGERRGGVLGGLTEGRRGGVAVGVVWIEVAQ